MILVLQNKWSLRLSPEQEAKIKRQMMLKMAALKRDMEHVLHRNTDPNRPRIYVP